MQLLFTFDTLNKRLGNLNLSTFEPMNQERTTESLSPILNKPITSDALSDYALDSVDKWTKEEDRYKPFILAHVGNSIDEMDITGEVLLTVDERGLTIKPL